MTQQIKTQFFKNIRALSMRFLALGAILLLSACSDSGIQVSVEFRNAQGVKEGTRVYYEGSIVGKVVEVDDSGSRVFMLIDEKSASKIDTQAAVVVNRIKPQAPLEIHASAAAQNFGLQNGHELKGLNSMIELVAWSVGDAIDVGTNELAGYVDSFQSYIASEGFQEDRDRVQQGVKEMALIASEAIKSVEYDLTEAIGDIDVTEEELVEAIRQLGDEMSPLAEEMAKGGTDLMAELEQFAANIEDASIDEQIAGQKLINSLVEAIDKLNSAAERGVQRSEQEGLDK